MSNFMAKMHQIRFRLQQRRQGGGLQRREMTSWPPSLNYDVTPPIDACLYWKNALNSRAKFHPDPIRNDGALC